MWVFGAIALVLGIWIAWVLFGVGYVHDRVLKDRVVVTGASQRTSKELEEERQRHFQELGQVGDLFGGVNALFSAITLVGVFAAAILQHRSLREAREALNHQQFESLFFRLLEFTGGAIEHIRYVGDEDEAVGARALDTIATVNFGKKFFDQNKAQSDRRLLKLMVYRYAKRIYDQRPSTLGPYLRLLYQTFSLVSDANLNGGKKRRFGNIARGQISEGAVLLLALNGLTERGKKFFPLIEEFGLLEHLHPRHSERYARALQQAYRGHAFVGSKERVLLGGLQEANHYQWDDFSAIESWESLYEAVGVLRQDLFDADDAKEVKDLASSWGSLSISDLPSLVVELVHGDNDQPNVCFRFAEGRYVAVYSAMPLKCVIEKPERPFGLAVVRWLEKNAEIILTVWKDYKKGEGISLRVSLDE